jgi:hypothetical protein
MADNKTKPTEISVAAFIAGITDETRRVDAQALVKLMQSATGEKPKMWGPSIVGFGSYHYKYDSGREGDMPLAGFSPRKAATVLYGVTGAGDSEALLAKLGKHTTGKGCLYIKKLGDVDKKGVGGVGLKSRRSEASPAGLRRAGLAPKAMGDPCARFRNPTWWHQHRTTASFEWAHGLARDGWRVLSTSNRYAFATSLAEIAQALKYSGKLERKGGCHDEHRYRH